MSRHYFDTFHKGFSVTVLLGWDRPMNYFFLVIEKPTELIDDTMKVESDDFLYSNLHESDPFNHDLDYYRRPDACSSRSSTTLKGMSATA